MGSAADEADTAVSSQAAPPAKHMWSPTEIVSVARALLMSLGDHSKADLQRVSPGLIMRDENDVLDLVSGTRGSCWPYHAGS